MSNQTLIQRARNIAAEQYIRQQVKRPTPDATLTQWAKHIEEYSGYLRDGSFDREREVQIALAALRSVAA